MDHPQYLIYNAIKTAPFVNECRCFLFHSDTNLLLVSLSIDCRFDSCQAYEARSWRIVRLYLAELVDVFRRQDQLARAARLIGALSASKINWPMSAQTSYNNTIQLVKASLGDEAFNKAWSEGQAMTLDQAIEDALQEEVRE